METVRWAECLFGSLSFASNHVALLRVNRDSSWAVRESCPDRQMSAGKHSRSMYCNFPNSSLPTTNNSCSSHKTPALSRGDGSRYWRSVVVTPFLLFSNSLENVIIRFSILPHVKTASPHKLEHCLLRWSLLSLWRVQYGYSVIFICLPSEMFAVIHGVLFHTNSFEPPKK